MEGFLEILGGFLEIWGGISRNFGGFLEIVTDIFPYGSLHYFKLLLNK